MPTKRIIPCLDVTKGRVVKGTKFLQLRDAGDPVECAMDVVERTAEQCFMPLTVGGGIRTAADVREMLLAGADKVSVNTAAILEPALISQSAEGFGVQCIVVAIDAKRTGPNRWTVFTHGGRKPTNHDAIEWAQEAERRGAGEILLTSMDSDGTKDGYDIDLTSAVSSAIGIPVIASGGAGKLEHLLDVLQRGSFSGQHLSLWRVYSGGREAIPGRARRAGPCLAANASQKSGVTGVQELQDETVPSGSVDGD